MKRIKYKETQEKKKKAQNGLPHLHLQPQTAARCNSLPQTTILFQVAP